MSVLAISLGTGRAKHTLYSCTHGLGPSSGIRCFDSLGETSALQVPVFWPIKWRCQFIPDFRALSSEAKWLEGDMHVADHVSLPPPGRKL